MKMQPSPSFFFLFNPGESLPLSRLVLFLPHVPPTSCAGITSWFNVLPSYHHTLFSSVFFLYIFFFPFHLVLFSHQTGFLSPAPNPASFQLNQGLTAPWRKKKSATLYFSTIRNGCVLPLFVHLGATLPCFRGLTVPTGLEDPKGNVGLGAVR